MNDATGADAPKSGNTLTWSSFAALFLAVAYMVYHTVRPGPPDDMDPAAAINELTARNITMTGFVIALTGVGLVLAITARRRARSWLAVAAAVLNGLLLLLMIYAGVSLMRP